VASDVCEILDLAAESWERRSSLEPPCEIVVRQMLDLLVSHDFAHVYYGS
jgi:hypothetical protein